MPSSWDPEDEICSAVARGFANWEVCMAAKTISRSLNSSFSLLDFELMFSPVLARRLAN